MKGVAPGGAGGRFLHGDARARAAAGTAAEEPLLLPLVERQSDDLVRLMASTDVHADTLGARCGVGRLDIGDGDRLAQRRGRRPGGDLADDRAVGRDDRVAGARDPAAPAIRPTSLRGGFASARSAAAASAARPTKSPSLVVFSNFTTRPRPASNGVVAVVSSCPYSGMPASRRRVSRQERPQGTSPVSLPASVSASQRATASAGRTNSSKPSSPVYPVRAISASTPATVPGRPA